jgi:hypothetical protein
MIHEICVVPTSGTMHVLDRLEVGMGMVPSEVPGVWRLENAGGAWKVRWHYRGSATMALFRCCRDDSELRDLVELILHTRHGQDE